MATEPKEEETTTADDHARFALLQLGSAVNGIGHLLLTSPDVPRAKRHQVERIRRELAEATDELLRAQAMYEAQIEAKEAAGSCNS